jgi:outer membrane lipoprotein-sorting protein
MRAKTGLVAAALVCLAILTAGCGGDAASTTTTSIGASTTALEQESTSTTFAGTLVYTATLKGANEVPVVKTSATGTLTLTVASDGSRVDYVVTIKKLTNVTVARLRQGEPGNSSGVLVTLFEGPTKTGTFTGTLAEGSFTAADLGGPLKGKTIADLVDLIESDQVYLNVGNSSHKSGAICGTLAPTSAAESSTTTLASSTTEGQSGSTSGSGSQALADLFGEYKQTKDVALDFAITGSGGVVSSGKMWSQAGKFMKLETKISGAVSVMIIDLAANTMIMYDPATKQGMKTTVSVPLQDPSSYADDVNVSDIQDLGTEKVNGETCRVVQYTTSTSTADATTITVKMWLSEKLGFPVKVVTTSADGTTTTIEYSNIKVGSLPDDTFKVPSDVKITTTP